MSDQTLNVPSLFLVVLVTSLAIRYFFFSGTRSARNTSPGRRINPAQVDQISTMFPQTDRRAIQWDLQRNGGSVAATTETILRRGFLDAPPPSFQPQLPPMTAPTQPDAPPKPPPIDLIKRYNLESKVKGKMVDDASANPPSWSNSKEERQELLKRKREEMILKARRRMEEKNISTDS